MFLRPMNDSDLDAVLAIETAATEFPWSLSQFADCVQSEDSATVLEVDNSICGFSIFQRVIDECSLLNIVVHPKKQAQGFGRLILEHGLGEQSRAGVLKCFLEVRISNIRAQSLYRSMGFHKVGVRKNYYPGLNEREDALVMSRQLPQALLETV